MSKKPQSSPAEVRDENGRFVKGRSGNPGGQTAAEMKARKSLAKLVRQLDSERSAGGVSHIIEALFDMFRDAVADGDAKSALAIGKELLDRGHGKARQDLSIDAEGGALRVVYSMPDNARG